MKGREPFLQSFLMKTASGRTVPSWRFWRWLAALGCTGTFVLSYALDIQVLEGAMEASRIVGFHLADPYAMLEVIASHGHLATNLAIGTATILLVYLIFGGRSFCSWICPYGLLSEIGDELGCWMEDRGWIRRRAKIPTRFKYIVWAGFLIASALSGVLVFEMLNIVGILSRLIIYGLWESALIVLAVWFIEVFFAKRAWCRGICPLGATYGLLNKVALIRIEADPAQCTHCGQCVKVCHVPEALSPVLNKKGKMGFLTSTDCTMCARCLDVCPHPALKISHRLRSLT